MLFLIIIMAIIIIIIIVIIIIVIIIIRLIAVFLSILRYLLCYAYSLHSLRIKSVLLQK